MAVRTILVIDDHSAVASAMEVLLRLRDIRTVAAQTPEEGLAVLARERIDLVIADMNFSADTTSGEEGAALFRALREAQPDLPVILITAWTHLETAVQLVKAGAADYIGKPWDNDKLLSTIENLLELAEATRERERLQRAFRRRRERLAAQYDVKHIVFESEAMERAVELACRVARADIPVLITGANGAGKERIAEIVHANSRARGGPFVAINCGAIPAELVEAELFGVEAGAYTGARSARAGRFQLADGGTLFLDEIGNLPIGGQVKLLRVLETGQFEQLGSSHTRTTRARIVSATNADLPALIRAGRFREDLYYRLNAIEIAVPPLSERTEDIVPLAQHFLGQDFELSEDALVALQAHDWPGNVRELRNAIERAKLLASNRVVSATDLNLPAAQRPIGQEGDPLTREVIEASLRKARGNISRAAQSLGLSRQALYRRMERCGLKT
ncbi:MAG TPA: sigma-54 dependent transcriptional regulator [Steroidobacteraceae bacterium]|jgi:DNA-binding NtrC family response regulator